MCNEKGAGLFKTSSSVAVLLVVITLACSCSSSNRLIEADRSATTPLDLNHADHAYDKNVVVYGYLIFSEENYALWQTPESVETNRSENCISIIAPESMTHELQDLNGKNVRMRGQFFSNVLDFYGKRTVILGLCNISALMVDAVEKQP